MGTIIYMVAVIAAFWVGMTTAFSHGGIIFSMISTVLITLKLTSTITWSWWWVCLPVWTIVGGAYIKVTYAATHPTF